MLFRSVPLNQTQWITTIVISFLPIPIMELQKKLDEVKYGKRFYQEKAKI